MEVLLCVGIWRDLTVSGLYRYSKFCSSSFLSLISLYCCVPFSVVVQGTIALAVSSLTWDLHLQPSRHPSGVHPHCSSEPVLLSDAIGSLMPYPDSPCQPQSCLCLLVDCADPGWGVMQAGTDFLAWLQTCVASMDLLVNLGSWLNLLMTCPAHLAHKETNEALADKSSVLPKMESLKEKPPLLPDTQSPDKRVQLPAEVCSRNKNSKSPKSYWTLSACLVVWPYSAVLFHWHMALLFLLTSMMSVKSWHDIRWPLFGLV